MLVDRVIDSRPRQGQLAEDISVVTQTAACLHKSAAGS